MVLLWAALPQVFASGSYQPTLCNFVQFPSCLLDGKICLILCALISPGELIQLLSALCSQEWVFAHPFIILLMEYITTCALPAFVLLLCQTKSFSSDPFLILIPYKSRVTTLLYLQRAFRLDDAKDVCMPCPCILEWLFWGEVSRH